MRDQSSEMRTASLQDVLDALTEMFARGQISKTEFRDTNSALRRYAKAVGKEPRRLKADIVELLDRMDETSALREGFMPRNWSNLKSLLRRALNLAGQKTKPARRDAPLSQSWQRLLDRSKDRDIQCRLRPFAGYCTDHKIEPGQVNEAVLDAFAVEVRAIGRSCNPRDRIRKVRRCWNRLVTVFADELTFRAETWVTPRKWAQPLEKMPKSFQDEMAEFKRARSPDTYEDVFRCRPLKSEKHVDDQCGTIMRIVAVLLKNGHPLAKITSFRYLVQPEHFEEIIRGLKKKIGVKDLRQLDQYVSTLCWLAKTWVRLGAGKMRDIERLVKVVGYSKGELSESSLDVLRQLDDPVKREKLKRLGEDIFREVKTKGADLSQKDARSLRNALFFELGLVTGWRPSSRARINIEDDIRWRGRKPRRVANLRAPKESEKTELARTVDLPRSTSEMLQYYMEHARALLLTNGDEDNPSLFPGRFGSHIRPNILSKQSEKLVALRTQVVGATAHKTRHIAAKLHLSENPGDWQTVQEHLGHRNVETTQTFYALATQLESSKRVQKSLGKR